jgi:hypothetical protein
MTHDDKILQGTVSSFDPTTSCGRFVLDDGTEHSFSADAFRASGLRLLRSGQRVRAILAEDGTVALITLLTM